MAEDGKDGAATNQPVFFAVSFAIVESGNLVGERAQALIQTLEENGAMYTPFGADTQRGEDITVYSHIISETTDFPQYQNALDHFVHIVKPLWVDASLSKAKALNPRSFSPDPSLFLQDVVVTCTADIPEGDKEAIIGGVIAMGGQYSAPMTKMVTHLVALSTDDVKYEVVMRKNLKCKTVLPHWFDDCLKLGKKIAEKPYMLPDPEILSSIERGPLAHVPNNAIQGATSPVPTDFPTPVTTNRVLDVFRGKKIMLSADLNIGSRIMSTIENLVHNGGGELVTQVEQADIYVCYYRDGEDYIKASQARKDVGNLAWLYHLITHNAWTSPMRRLLHYPVPRHGIPGFSDYHISLSNYVGDSRIYLENLVKACGAEFTKTMRQENTHLITAHTQSEKCEAAREWNIHIVNHIWLEESYAQCKQQSLTKPRYTHFPSRTNLGEVVGQTQIDPDAVEARFFPKGAEERRRKGPQTNGVAVPSRPKQEEVPSMNTLTVADTTQTTAAQEGADDAVSERATPLIKKDDRAQTTAPQEGADEVGSERATPLIKKSSRVRNDAIDAQTPMAARVAEGKENETPSTAGSRGAKSRALTKLHDLAPDIALYEREKKRAGGVLRGGRRLSEPESAEKPQTKSKEARGTKRSLEPEGEVEGEASAETVKETGRKTKKSKSSLTPIVHKLMMSGDDRWVGKGKTKKEHEDKSKLRDMGINVVTKPDETTLLCAPKIVRTRKFVAALAAAPHVVSTSFLDDCLRSNRMPDPLSHPLIDREGEKRWGIKLSDTIFRAQQNRGQLLKGWDIFVTENVTGGWETYKDIIKANGGNCLLWKGRATKVSKREVKKSRDTDGDANMDADLDTEAQLEANRSNDGGKSLYLVSGTDQAEVKLWPKFKDVAKKADMTPYIVTPDWILFVTMAQYIHHEERWEIRPDEVPGLAGKK
ncbi:uncharacterized protein K452DRAFT_356047 [Aplosporella prunicola CBS 121167]|uniref:BRCT domain-containing protein n=1 Tax=Aplosporella prunicola CBS 121167 TaxID=1176127 RepID=A0A6A6BQX1_9PEZI|nr:uncharacterized protein K452DRAFT_356047 [Aplosporella prunicola CBS 121167]KAF2145634.1 hypothetical protein K452DRAFT_356047 [Aplosporella prunicola CBS 121167]